MVAEQRGRDALELLEKSVWHTPVILPSAGGARTRYLKLPPPQVCSKVLASAAAEPKLVGGRVGWVGGRAGEAVGGRVGGGASRGGSGQAARENRRVRGAGQQGERKDPRGRSSRGAKGSLSLGAVVR